MDRRIWQSLYSGSRLKQPNQAEAEPRQTSKTTRSRCLYRPTGHWNTRSHFHRFEPSFTERCYGPRKYPTPKVACLKNQKPIEVDEKVEADFANWLERWIGDARNDEKIAFEIYQRTMLEEEISKAVTAQVFAAHLEDRLKGPRRRCPEVRNSRSKQSTVSS